MGQQDGWRYVSHQRTKDTVTSLQDGNPCSKKTPNIYSLILRKSGGEQNNYEWFSFVFFFVCAMITLHLKMKNIIYVSVHQSHILDKKKNPKKSISMMIFFLILTHFFVLTVRKALASISERKQLIRLVKVNKKNGKIRHGR